jgi:DNA repair protein RadC
MTVPAGRRGTGIWRFVRQPHGDWTRERLLIAVLDQDRRVVRMREVPPAHLTVPSLRRAIKGIPLARIGGLVSIHNHPRVNPRPPKSHWAIARRVQEVADALGVPVLDQLVFCRGRYHPTAHRRRR